MRFLDEYGKNGVGLELFMAPFSPGETEVFDILGDKLWFLGNLGEDLKKGW